jgi:hypothetical protein
MPTIVTHPGQAHRDEFLSCCLFIATGEADCIERRKSTDADFSNPDRIVLDQGEIWCPEFLNFDHHQFPRDAAPTCSITIVLEYLGIDVEQARKIWGWLEFSELLDSKGPFATAEKLGSNPDALFAGMSPIETTVLLWFQSESSIEAYRPRLPAEGPGRIRSNGEPNPLWDLMSRIGREKLDYLGEVVERVAYLRENVMVVEIGGLRFLDATCIDRDDNPTLGLDMLAKEMGDIAGTVTQDDRGDGLTLFRREDHPRLDFSRLEGRGGVVFAHKGGFVAKLEAGVDCWTMLKAAIVPDEPELPLISQKKQHVIDVRVVCNSEPAPGWGHDPQDMADAAAVRAAAVLGSYDPIIIGCEVKDLEVDELTAAETATIVQHLAKEKV